eukprot:COSAG02_NODE_8339_length_2608_cov_2.116381_1_plen_58_part_10
MNQHRAYQQRVQLWGPAPGNARKGLLGTLRDPTTFSIDDTTTPTRPFEEHCVGRLGGE